MANPKGKLDSIWYLDDESQRINQSATSVEPTSRSGTRLSLQAQIQCIPLLAAPCLVMQFPASNRLRIRKSADPSKGRSKEQKMTDGLSSDVTRIWPRKRALSRGSALGPDSAARPLSLGVRSRSCACRKWPRIGPLCRGAIFNLKFAWPIIRPLAESS